MKLSKKKIDLVRATHCMTVPELAKAYGVSRIRMYNILNQSNATPVCAGRLARALGVDLTEIIDTENE